MVQGPPKRGGDDGVIQPGVLMNRRISGVVALAVALAGVVTVGVRAQRGLPPATIAERLWQAERTHQLNNVRERARYQLDRSMLRVEIGTLAQMDMVTARQSLEQIDALVKADAARPNPLVKTPQEIAAIRIRLAESLNALDAMEVRFDVGMVTTREMNDAYLKIVKLLVT